MCDFATSSAIQSSTTDNSPQWMKDFYQNLAKENTSVYNTAKSIYEGNKNYPAYNGPRVAQLTPQQMAGIARTEQSVGIGSDTMAQAGQNIGLGGRSMGQALGQQAATFNPAAVQTQNYNQSYRPEMVNPITGTFTNAPMPMNVGNPEVAGPSNFGSAQAQQYMNPYTDTVIKNTLSEMDRSNAQGVNQDAARASAAKAFGGSRHGIVDAERNRNFQTNVGNTVANLQNQNFAQAQQQFNTDTNRNLQNAQNNAGMNMQGQLANQQAHLQAGLQQQSQWNNMSLQNAGIINNAQLANEQLRQQGFGINRDTFNQNQDRSFATQVQNQNMGLQGFNANRDQYNTDASRQLQAGNAQMQSAAQQQAMAMQDNNNLLNVGALHQNQIQKDYDTTYQEHLNRAQYPYQQFNFLQSALQGNSFNPYQGISGTSTTQKGGDASALQQVAGLGMTAAGLFGGGFF